MKMRCENLCDAARGNLAMSYLWLGAEDGAADERIRMVEGAIEVSRSGPRRAADTLVCFGGRDELSLLGAVPVVSASCSLTIATAVAADHTVPEPDRAPPVAESTTRAHQDDGANDACDAP